MYKSVLLITILALFACGKANTRNRKNTLAGNGRNSGEAESNELHYGIDGGLPKYLTSDYQFANFQTVTIDPNTDTQTKEKEAAKTDQKQTATEQNKTTPVAVNLAHYIQVRVALIKTPTSAQDATTAAAAVVAKPPGAPKTSAAPPATHAFKHTYEYFYEEIVTCLDGNIAKGTIIGHADLPGEGKVSKNAPLKIPGGGSLSIIPAASSKNKTKTPTHASFVLEKAVGSMTTVNLTMRHSMKSKEQLAEAHSKLPTFTDKQIEKNIQDFAKSCVNVQGTPPRSIKPDDVQEQEPTITTQSLVTNLENDI